MKKLSYAQAAKFVSAAFVAGAFVFTSVAHAATVVVSGDTAAGENLPGWLFNRDVVNATPIEFNTDAQSIGTGALYVEPLSDTEAARKFIGEYFLLEEIANVNSVSYDFLIGSGGDASDENEFYMSVYANFGSSPDTKFYDCRYSVVPTIGSNAGFTTVTFDPTQSYPVTTRVGADPSPFTCPSVPADMDNLSASSTIRMFALNMGDTSSNDANLDGYFDNVVVDLDSGVTVFDFDPAPVVPVLENKDQCKGGGWATFGFKNQGQCIKFVNTGKDSR